jgi:predicted GH43/DUF377 family glycosyl hydrolase
MSEIVIQPPKNSPPPRILRNKTALDKYLADNKIESLWPPIDSQLFTVSVKGLPPGAYNPSIIRFRGRLVMTFRFHETTLKTKLGIAELDENFNVIYLQELNLDEDDTLSLEDARLFIWKGELWMSFVVSNWPNFPASQVKICKLSKPDHWRFSDKELYWLPDRQTMEKNHVPLVFDDVFNIIYKHAIWQDNNPADIKQVIYAPFEKREMKNPALRWPYGEIRGGTPPLPYKGHLISFFHSSVRNFPPPQPQCYFVGALVMKADKPFNMLSISKRPIIYGSDVGGDKSRFHWKTRVVFPLGAIADGENFRVSIGVNDSQCAIVTVTEKDLNL